MFLFTIQLITKKDGKKLTEQKRLRELAKRINGDFEQKYEDFSQRQG